MKKKEKSRKNVFGLVSKLGNLIKKGGGTKNTDNMDTSAGEDDLPKKNFNIHISEDNQEQIEIDDDEEEEEEEDETEKEEKKDLNEKKEDETENQNNIQSKVEENINNEKIIDNANNINHEKVNNETNNKEEIKQENNIINNTEKTNEKINTAKEEEGKESNNIILNDNINNDINTSTKEDSKPQENIDNQIKEDFENMKEENLIEDINEACHLYLKKGNDFNAKEIYCIPITQIKNRKKKSLLQKMNVFKKEKNEVINYKIFMEENFIYFAKDIIIDKKNDALRRIYKVYNIRNILNYTSSKESENNKYKIVFEMVNKKFVNKSKEYFIEEQYFKDFNNEVMKKLKIYGDKLNK